MKLCTMCGKPDGPFGLKSGEAGLRGALLARCRACQRIAVRASKAKKPDMVAEYNKKWWANNPEKREFYAANYVPDKVKLAAASERWRQNNREKCSQKSRLYGRAHRDERRLYARKWLSKNREAHNARLRERYANGDRTRRLTDAQNRRAKLTGGRVTLDEWQAIIAEFDSRCAYCMVKLAKPTMDHVVALARGGAHSLSNIVPACKPCNYSKNAKPLGQWLDLDRDFKVIAKAA